MKKNTVYSDNVTKGKAYVLYHFADRLLATKIIANRSEIRILLDEYNRSIADNGFINFPTWLKTIVTNEQWSILRSNRKQLLWSCCFLNRYGSSSLCVTPETIYKQINKMSDLEFEDTLKELQTMDIMTESGIDCWIFK